MSYGINVIQVVPFYFVLIKFAVVKHQTFSMTLDVFIPFIQRSHVLKCNMAEINYHHARKNDKISLFLVMEFRPPAPLK